MTFTAEQIKNRWLNSVDIACDNDFNEDVYKIAEGIRENLNEIQETVKFDDIGQALTIVMNDYAKRIEEK